MRMRRSKEEIVRVVEQYRSSGMTRAEFCRRSGIPVATMGNYCRRHAGRGLVQVEVEAPQKQAGQIAIVLGRDRRVEIGSGFDDAILMRVIRVVEAA
jgi:DNA-binding transcriptional regulator LsrR (DeoR family)